MFVGALGIVYTVLSLLWLPGSLLLILGFFGKYRYPDMQKRTAQYSVQWGFLLLAVSFAWQSVDQILMGVLTSGERTIGFGMFRFLLVIFPVLLLQVMVFLRRDIKAWTEHKAERLRLAILGTGIFAAFYSTVLAYTLADAETITNCLYVAPEDYKFNALNNWARSLCR